ncbi:antibiotic biosynthesis monooxygenase family protein [Nocardioides gilvus]|uniref:antibiotic biosynthesis monooxygenase family protein n=1 Tax=Nocardioides gilvus TaxID=1735589 RepID=UPI000D74B4B6|nr:antibiotic biosynthesis monooxygenase family protein [Nocardioides gilvus]
MIVINRFCVPLAEGEAFRESIQAAHLALSAQRGFVDGTIGRNLDDPSLWVLHTQWSNVGSYRRALSAYDVKVTAVPVLSRALDEPSAYEPVIPGATLNEFDARSLG